MSDVYQLASGKQGKFSVSTENGSVYIVTLSKWGVVSVTGGVLGEEPLKGVLIPFKCGQPMVVEGQRRLSTSPVTGIARL